MATMTRRPRTTKPAEKVRPGPAYGHTVLVDTKALRWAIRGSGLTHAQLAKLAGFGSAGTVSNLVANGSKHGPGARRTCRPETAKALSKALGLSVEDHREIFRVVVSTPGV